MAGASPAASPPQPTGLTLTHDDARSSARNLPAVKANTANYTVTATGAGGSHTAILNITVDDLSTSSQSVPNMDQTITPLLPTGSRIPATGHGQRRQRRRLAGSGRRDIRGQPDGSTLLVLTSGYNGVFNATSASNLDFEPKSAATEYVFVYDISTHTPIQKQVVKIPLATYHGIAFDPNSTSTNAHFFT